MKRRQFIASVGAAAVLGARGAGAQLGAKPVVGFLHAGYANSRTHLVASFLQGLKEAGFVEGQNVAVEFRWANDQLARLPAMASDLVSRRVSLIATPATNTSSNAALAAAKAATNSIPIVFAIPEDPVENGLVASINRPGANITGIHYLSTSLVEKRLGLLRELAPSSALLAVLVDPNNQGALTATREVQTAANLLGQKIEIVEVGDGGAVDAIATALTKIRADAFSLIPDTLFFSRRVQIVTLVNRMGMPSIFTSREYVEAGGLMSYGTDLAGVYRQVGGYAGRILNGANAADLPIEQSSKFEFVLNLQTSKALKIEVPPMLLARADEVIE